MKFLKSKNLSVLIIILIVVTIFIFTIGTKKETPEDNKKTISASIFPLYDIVRNIAGDDLRVLLLLPPGTSPHTFEPSPETVREISNSSTIYLIGHGVDNWAAGLAESTETTTVIVDQNIELRTEEKEEIGVDPHYWLNIKNAKQIAQNVAADLTIRFPNLTSDIEKNLNQYLKELDRADLRIKEILQDTGNRQLVTLHDAWYYFAEAYGLTIVGSFVPSPGREPTPQWLAELGTTITQAGTNTLFSEPQISTETLEPFLDDNNLKVAILDPIGGNEYNTTYIQMMIFNAETIAQNQ